MPSRPVNQIVIHCSATPNGRSVMPGDIDDWHYQRGFRRSLVWRDRCQTWLKAIGYHYFIGLDGIVTNGRHLDEVGAHVAGSNARSVGICMVGTDRFTEAQWRSLSQLIRTLESRYPQAQVLGHRDCSPDADGDGVVEPHEWLKTCPGFDVRAWRTSGMGVLPARTFYPGVRS